MKNLIGHLKIRLDQLDKRMNMDKGMVKEFYDKYQVALRNYSDTQKEYAETVHAISILEEHDVDED